VEQTSPDNLKNTLQIGECLIKLEKYEEALPYLHKVEYLEKTPDNARRAIGWCYFIQGKYEEALKYYNLLLQEESPAKQDWMNAGHTYIGMKQYPQAIEHYTKAKELCQSHTEFLEIVNEDKQQLLTLISEEDLSILLDLVV
jgi:tetratricopeptide (TPR) repeat protein